MAADAAQVLAQRIGRRIQELRHAKGWGQIDLEAHLDGAVTRSTISYLETGKRLPSLRTLLDVAEALGVHPASLLLEPSRSYRDAVVDAALRCTKKQLRRVGPSLDVRDGRRSPSSR